MRAIERWAVIGISESVNTSIYFSTRLATKYKTGTQIYRTASTFHLVYILFHYNIKISEVRLLLTTTDMRAVKIQKHLFY